MTTVETRADLLSRLAESPAARALEPAYERLGEALRSSGLAERLEGGGLMGHSAHPVLTDVPVGLWTATSVLDILGGPKSHRAAAILCTLGVVSAAPTAATGLADWTRLEGESRRLGVLHAAGNALAVTLYAESAWRRLRGRHLRATASALLGGVVMTAAGYLGGELALNRGAAARRPAYDRMTPPAPGTAPTP
ncbi:DUF2231 domain-containing protein [Nocardioides montaniterrae]